MALNRVYAAKLPAIVREVPEGTKSGDFLVVNNRPVVALTDRGDATETTKLGEYAITHPSGGASLKDNEASLYVDGTYDLPVIGATEDTENDVPVYLEDGRLVLTVGAGIGSSDGGDLGSGVGAGVGSVGLDIPFGYTNYPPDNYVRKDGIAPVRIGA